MINFDIKNCIISVAVVICYYKFRNWYMIPYVKIYYFNHTLSNKWTLLINIFYLFSNVYNKNPLKKWLLQ